MFTDLTGKRRYKINLHCHSTRSDGRISYEEVLAAYDKVGEIAARHDVPLMLSYGFNPREIKEWMDRGARLIHVNGDVGFVHNAARYEYEELRRLAEGSGAPALYGGVEGVSAVLEER